MEIEKQLSVEMGLSLNHTNNIINLLDEGCTIPFIARYRKEKTGSLSDDILRDLHTRLMAIRALDEKRAKWASEDCYVFPGAIQYFGPAAVCDVTTITLQLEQEKALVNV